MKSQIKNLVIFSVSIAVTLLSFIRSVDATEVKPHPLPAFTQTSQDAWIQSKPLKVSDLHGSVTLVDIWTFECWNCYRSFPWLNDLENRLKDKPFKVLGIHTPEFEHEHVRSKVEAKSKEFGLKHPTMMDNDFGYWKALNNRYWPTYYLVDKKGMIRYRFIGETHAGTPKAKKIEQAIETLLKES